MRNGLVGRGVLAGIDPATAALTLAAATPLLMVFSRGITPVVLAVVTLLVALGALGAGYAPDARRRLIGFFSTTIGRLAVVAAAYMALSLAWTPAVARGAEFTAHVVGSGLMIAIAMANLAAAPPVDGPRSRWLPALLAGAAGLAFVELRTGAPVRTFLGLSVDDFRLNRAAIALALFLPLAVTLLFSDARRLAAVLLAALIAAAVFASQSESAKLALLVLAPAWAIARFASRIAPAAFATAVITSLAVAPLLATVINALLPEVVYDAVGYGTLGIRGEIWTRYAWLIAERPFFGYGMEAGSTTATITADWVGVRDRELLDYGHPHNFAIQVWFELGLVGVLLTAALIALAFRAIARIPEPIRAAALATAVAIWTVAFVSHGAWQAWWWCLVGLVALTITWAAMARRAPHARD